uniref:Glycogen phosphorylase n=1 Tax=Meloidogyne hapla TaxID=6305 RepID=A0A1I8BMN0_MELHA
MVRALRYVDAEIIDGNPDADVFTILKHCLTKSIEGLTHFNVNEVVEKLRKVIEHYNSLLPTSRMLFDYDYFARTNNPLIYYQNYIIKKGLNEIFERNQEEYESFIKTWRIEPHGNDKNPEAVMGVVGILR